MSHIAKILKTTALGGLVFLVPLVVGALLLLKALEYMNVLARPFHRLVGLEDAGVLALNALALCVIVVICLGAGLLAKTPPVRRFGDRIEALLAGTLPGYEFVKGFTDSMRESDNAARGFKPIVAKFDDNAQIAFEVERSANGSVIVYLPGAPNPWSGSIIHMSPERVEPLGMSMPETIKLIRRLGHVPAPPDVVAP